MDKYG